ncbi:hypothetical protein ES705_41883 [subsurface metagenome]
MATLRELKSERVQAARAARRLQRAADSAIERLERRMDTLIARKQIIDRESAATLVPLYNDFRNKVRIMENGIADFITVVSL